MKKVSQILLWLFGAGVLLTLFAGGVALVLYVVAMCIGGESAQALCGFVYKSYFPCVIQVCSVSVGLGLIGMYLQKRKALTVVSDEKKDAT